MTSIQTTVDDEIADAFTAWATENYKSKAAALRDYIIKAPKGESVHSNVTNADLEAQIADLEDTIESGSFSGHQQNQQNQQQNENQSESDAEDANPIEMYDPEVGADDLLTTSRQNTAMLRVSARTSSKGLLRTGRKPVRYRS